MSLVYRAVFRLPAEVDAIQVANQELQSWLKSKLDRRSYKGVENGDAFNTGVRQLGDGARLITARVCHDGDKSVRQILRFEENNSAGKWAVTLSAFTLPNADRYVQTLVVQAEKLDGGAPGSQVDPPRLVADLLGREPLRDGITPLVVEPQVVREYDVRELIDAITDPSRSASIVVAGSVGPEYDNALRKHLRSLTRKLIGVAATYVVTSAALTELNLQLGGAHEVQAGRVRTFLPAVQLNDTVDSRRHKILGPATFARSIHRNKVAEGLQLAFAFETRSRLLEAPLPSDVKRGLELLTSEMQSVLRAASIEHRLKRNPIRPVRVKKRINSRESEVPILERIGAILDRWLSVKPPATIEALARLDTFIAREKATAETFADEALELERVLENEKARADSLVRKVEDLELELAQSEDDATALNSELVVLRGRLVRAGRAEDAFVDKVPVEWGPPEDLMELIARITEGDHMHQAGDFVRFTGDTSAVAELQRSDPLGRYARSMWDFIRVLHGYSVAKTEQGFRGSVHNYLSNDETDGHKCSVQRHAASESNATVSQWGEERVFPVPRDVELDGQLRMLAHFRPTHENTLAPRMYYCDDIDNTGKIYVGYIGKHLTNTLTKNS